VLSSPRVAEQRISCARYFPSVLLHLCAPPQHVGFRVRYWTGAKRPSRVRLGWVIEDPGYGFPIMPLPRASEYKG
jgi:hypothetical protein